MTFLFEDIFSGEIRYVYASDLSQAIHIFESHKESSDSSDFKYLHVYVRIM